MFTIRIDFALNQSKIGPKLAVSNAVCSLRTLNYSNVIDIDFFLVKKSKIDAA